MTKHLIETWLPIAALGEESVRERRSMTALLPAPTADRPHGLKYRLYCGRGARCVVRYDNETGKGDHRHYGRREEAYVFESVEKLVVDFESDCERLTGWGWE